MSIKRITLRDLAADKFPLRFEAYSKMHDELTDAAEGFSRLGYENLACEMDAVRSRLEAAWNAIVVTEQAGR